MHVILNLINNLVFLNNGPGIHFQPELVAPFNLLLDFEGKSAMTVSNN